MSRSKKSEKLVSIIIPTYGGSNSLIKAIDSALNQSYSNIEVVVVDDNATNSIGRKNTELIMNKYNCNNKVKYIKHNENKNGSAARNTGVINSNGYYISFLDDDDYFFEDKIEKQVALLQKKNADFCVCFYIKNGVKYCFEVKDDYIDSVLLLKNTPQTSSFVMTRNLYNKINGFDESYSRHQDYEFLIRICLNTKVICINEFLYERVGNSIENRPNANKMKLIKDKLLRDFDYIFNKRNINKKKVYAKNYSYVFYLYIREKNIKKAILLMKDYFSVRFILFFVLLTFSNVNKKINFILNKGVLFKNINSNRGEL